MQYSQRILSSTVLLGAVLVPLTSPTYAQDSNVQAGEVPATAPPVEAQPNDFRVYWKNGLYFETRDKQFKFKIGGRLQNDWWFIANESDGLKDELAGRSPLAQQESGTNFRRARIYMSGSMKNDMYFKWAYDFGGGTPDFKDAYIGWKKVPVVGSMVIGQQKEPIGLEFAYSSNSATFIERGLPHYMNPERSTGVRVSRVVASDSLYLTAGAYRPSNAQGDSGIFGDSFSFSGRAAWSPIYEDKGEKLLHLGVNGSYRTGLAFYGKSMKPEVDGMARYIAASVSDPDNVIIGGLEASANMGPLSVQGEYVVNSISREAGGSAAWAGWYTYVSYFLTGEHRPYKRDRGAYSAPTPKHDHGDTGSGAWELALRYSSMDMGDSNNTFQTNGSKLNDITAGVNWYLSYHTRIMLNYIHADIDSIGSSDAVSMRFQVFF
jgi:phosphate-selective porin OprO and OprP